MTKKVTTEEQKESIRERNRQHRATSRLTMTEEQKDHQRKLRKAATARRREKSYDDVLKKAREYRMHGRGYYSAWICTIRKRAKEKGVPFDLDIEFLQSIMPTHCPVLGVELTREFGEGPLPTSPTVDRIFPELGYVRHNVMIISKRANQIKTDATPEEITRVATYYTKLYDGLR